MKTDIAESVLAVVGFAEMTAANSKLFRKRVCAALNGHTTVEIDLSQTTFIDCAGLGALTAPYHARRTNPRNRPQPARDHADGSID
jgi:anti-anti-sigma regulatory factor